MQLPISLSYGTWAQKSISTGTVLSLRKSFAAWIAPSYPLSIITWAMWTPLGPYSRARPAAVALSPAFAAAKAIKGGRDFTEAVAPVKRICTSDFKAIRLAAARPATNPPKQQMRQASSKNCCARRPWYAERNYQRYRQRS